jgi:hypothetical protein
VPGKCEYKTNKGPFAETPCVVNRRSDLLMPLMAAQSQSGGLAMPLQRILELQPDTLS